MTNLCISDLITELRNKHFFRFIIIRNTRKLFSVAFSLKARLLSKSGRVYVKRGP